MHHIALGIQLVSTGIYLWVSGSDAIVLLLDLRSAEFNHPLGHLRGVNLWYLA